MALLPVTDATSWKNFQEVYIERLMDHSALSSAHPDDTLILAGPPRWLYGPTNKTILEGGGAKQIFDSMLPIGMVQSMEVNQQKPTTPMQAIGSGRSFYVSGKAMGSSSIARLFVNGRNLLRALYTNAISSGVDATQFDDAAAWNDPKAKFYANLDSELFLIPFGLAVFFRDKLHDEIGAFYLELCAIQAWSITISAGQSIVMENVRLIFDRLRPISTAGIGLRSTDNYDPRNPAESTVFQAIFNGTTIVNPGTGEGDDVVDTES